MWYAFVPSIDQPSSLRNDRSDINCNSSMSEAVYVYFLLVDC